MFFSGRYKAIAVDEITTPLELCRYMVLNPALAKVVQRPEDWKWSSYRGMLGQDHGAAMVSGKKGGQLFFGLSSKLLQVCS
jgi:hypothetical protein